MSSSYDFINLLLADGIARRCGLNRAAACKRWARRARANTKDAKVYETAKTIISAKRDSHIVDMLDKLTAQLKQDGVL